MTAPRSNFVTILAWLSLAMAVLGVVNGALQWIMLLQLQSNDAWQQWLESIGSGLPVTVLWLIRHLDVVTLISVGMSMVFAVVSWALLQRREWGRISFIALLVLSCALPIAGAMLMGDVLDWMDAQLAADPALRDPALVSVQNSLRLLGHALSAVIVVFHLGLAWKLCTPRIREEFT